MLNLYDLESRLSRRLPDLMEEIGAGRSGGEAVNVGRGHICSFVGRLRGALSLRQLRRRSGFVLVTVLDAGREVDSFRASDPEVLVAALRPICRHLPEGDCVLRFTGVEEEWLAWGLGRVRREVELRSASEAVSFLNDESRSVRLAGPLWDTDAP